MTALPETALNQFLRALVVIMAVIAAAFAVVTSHRRRARQEARSSAHALERRFADFLAGRAPAATLGAAAERAESSAFWAARLRIRQVSSARGRALTLDRRTMPG